MSSNIDALIQKLKLEKLAARAARRFPRQPEQPDLLPEVASFDTAAARVSMMERFEGTIPKSRQKLGDQCQRLQEHFSEQPELLFWNALSMSYLRRRTKYSSKAQDVFFKIWDEQGSWLAGELSPRWLVSSLQTFSDYGRTAAEQKCGAIGFMYGNFVKVYETEINSVYQRSEFTGKFTAGRVRGLHGFQPGNDILLNMNKLAIASALEAGPAGEALLRLVAAIRDGDTVFSRTDEITRQNGEGFLSFHGHYRREKRN